MATASSPERQYGNPDFAETQAPQSPLIAAAPDSITGSIKVTPESTGTVTEAKMTLDNAPKRVYGNPDFEIPMVDKTVINEPKDINQAAAGARLPGQVSTGQTGKAVYDTDVEDSFKWTPTAPTSGVGSSMIDVSTRAYAPALKDYLSSMGYIDPKTGNGDTRQLLQPKYEAAYSKVMEGHGAPVYPMVPTPEALQKYNQEYNDYVSRLASAKSAGLAAVQAEKEGLTKKATEWSDNIAKENEKIIGRDGEMLYDKSKRAAANAILNNQIQISAVNHALGKAKDLPEILAQIPSLAYAAGVARNPEQTPTEFAIQETKGIVDAIMPMTDEGLKKQAIDALLPWLVGKLSGKDVGPSPLEIIAQKAGYNNPVLIKQRMIDYMVEVGKMNNGSKSRYIKGSKDVEFPVKAIQPPDVSDTDFTDPNSPKKADAIFGSLMRWNKMTSLTPEEVRLGVKDPNKSATGENEGIVAFQSYLKNKLGATNYKVTGIPSADDQAALQMLMNIEPSKSAKDIMTEALAHKGMMDGSLGGETSGKSGKVNTPKASGTAAPKEESPLERIRRLRGKK